MAKMTPKWFTPCVLFTLLVLPLVTSAGLDALGSLLGDALGVVEKLPNDVESLVSTLQNVTSLLSDLAKLDTDLSEPLTLVNNLLSYITSSTPIKVVKTILKLVVSLLTGILTNVNDDILTPIIQLLNNVLSTL